MKRRLLPILMTLVLVCALPIWAAFVTSGDVTNPLVETAEGTTPARVTTESALRTALENGVSGIVLGEDIDISGAALVAKGTSTLDLNGFMLRRVSQSTGSVIQVDAGATLTLTDSGNGSKTYPFKKNAEWGYWEYSVKQGDTWFEGGIIAGRIAHAKLDDGNGGGVHVAKGGTFIMEKGKIIGCQADKNGGGVYVADGGKFIMNGGEINGCVTYSGDKGGNVYVGAGAVFQMGDSARITECIARASSGGGVYVAENGTFTMSGSSTIDNCKASSGGAVYNAGTFTMGGSSRIKDCTYYYGNTSGGVHNKGTFTVEGGSITGSMNDGSSGDDISNENKLDVSEGITISCNVKVGYGGTISKGTFTGRVWNSEGTILGGTFTNEVINYEGTIKAGEFTGKIENSYGKIDGGTFRGSVTSSGYNAIISDGNFHGTVTNESGATISGGTFDENVTNKTYAILNGGIFYGGVTNDGGTINDSAYVTVTFNSDGGTPVEGAKVLRGQEVAKPTDDPTKSGYTFIGWEDADGAYDFSKSVTAPLTLTAKWEKVPSSGGYYYYHPTTDTKTDGTKGSPKTFDPGAALYGALALLSLTGMVALNGKKR